MQRRHADRGDDRALPAQRHVAGLAFVGRHQRCTEGFDDRLHRQHERMARQATHEVSGRRSACRLTWVAPLAKAASSTALRHVTCFRRRHAATGAERAEVDLVPQRLGRLDGRSDVRTGLALDERLDGELDQQHATEL